MEGTPTTYVGSSGQIMTSAPARKARRVPVPRVWPIKANDVYAFLAGNAVLILGMWIRHGNLSDLSTAAGTVIAAGELTALYGTYLILVQLVLMSRNPWLDQVFGQDRVTQAHRWVGFAAVWLLLAHGVLTTVGYAMSDKFTGRARFKSITTRGKRCFVSASAPWNPVR